MPLEQTLVKCPAPRPHACPLPTQDPAAPASEATRGDDDADQEGGEAREPTSPMTEIRRTSYYIYAHMPLEQIRMAPAAAQQRYACL